MEFSKEFINKCKEIYPDWKELHQKLEEGNVFALRYLDDARYEKITAEEVLNAESLNDLKIKAMEINEKQKLYSQALEMYRNQKESDENS